MSEKVKLHFLGAAGTVTGSKFLLEADGKNILIDCGMFQGSEELRELNRESFAFPPEKIDMILLTHGHLDHCGYIPKLRQQGFRGPVYGTAPSLAVASVILLDSAKIMEEQAQKASEDESKDQEPALPFYSVLEAEAAIRAFKSVVPDFWNNISKEIRYRFLMNGHILGATFIEMEVYGKTFIFSGDIGREKDDLLDQPERPVHADFMLLESTYGDRLHPPENPEKILLDAAREALEKKGNLIIPSFAVERLQLLMYKLWNLHKKGLLPDIPVFIDSPMGSQVLELFSRFPSWHKLKMEDLKGMRKHFHITASYRDTWKIIDDPKPKIIIAGSGMVSGGRVLTYLRYYIEKPETTVLLAGFQAEGTRGRQLLEGADEIKIFGKNCEVKARILQMQSLSAHADQQELLNWLSKLKKAPEKIFLIHGEPIAADTLRLKIEDTYGWATVIPQLKEVVELEI